MYVPLTSARTVGEILFMFVLRSLSIIEQCLVDMNILLKKWAFQMDPEKQNCYLIFD
jgi:hypothetical protein